MTTRQLNQLERQVMERIILGDRLFSYWTPQDFVYVTKFNEILLIHYRMIFSKNYLVIKWCLTSERHELKFTPQQEGIILKPMISKGEEVAKCTTEQIPATE